IPHKAEESTPTRTSLPWTSHRLLQKRGGKQPVTASDSDSTHANDRGGTKDTITKEAHAASAAAVGDGVCREEHFYYLI
ncbi:hypothetical protein HPB47_026175, partial [Ixodes persulcatus]